MALRFLMYSGRVYEKLINNDEMYSESRIMIPTPEFYVLYNGIKPFPKREIYRLSDSFLVPLTSNMPLDLVVTAFNINPGFNDDIVQKDENLHGYVMFISKARAFEKSGMSRESADKSAVEECIKQGILVDYLQNNASEVINMLAQEWDWNKALEINARDAARETEAHVNKVWQAIVADKDTDLANSYAALVDKDAEIAALKAKLNEAQSQK